MSKMRKISNDNKNTDSEASFESTITSTTKRITNVPVPITPSQHPKKQPVNMNNPMGRMSHRKTERAHESYRELPESRHHEMSNSPNNRMRHFDDSYDFKPPLHLLKELENDGIFLLKKKSLRFVKARYICRLCEYHCDTYDICRRHMQDSRHVQQKEGKMLESMLKSFPGVIDPQVKAITELIQSISKEQGLTSADLQKRETVKKDLENKLRQVVQGSSLQTNGSTLSGFALKSSNMNLDVSVPEDVKIATALLAVLKIITESDSYCDIDNELSSSYPCIHFTHKQSNIRLEVGVSSPYAQSTNLLLSYYRNLDHRVRPLTIAFRYWAKLCHIDNQRKGTLPAHSFPLMVIHYLQQISPPVLPSLHALHSKNSTTLSENYITPDEIRPPWKSENTDLIGKLFVDLFKFYSVDYKMSHFVINIRSLEPLLRKERTWGKKMAIEDPFQTKRNLTRSVSSSAVFDYIVLRIKSTYRYFITPQMEFGPLYKRIFKEGIELDIKFMNDYKTLASNDQKSCDSPETESSSERENESVDDANDELGEENGKKDVPAEKFIFQKTIQVEDIDTKSKTETIIPNLQNVSCPIDLINWLNAVILMKQIKKNDLHYSFSERNFTDGRKPPVICSSCLKIGHNKINCKEYELPPLTPIGILTPRYYESLAQIFQSLKDEFAPSPKETLERDDIVRELEAYIRQSFEGANLTLFGSSANGFGFSKSDLDICLMFQGHPTGEKFDHISVIEELAEKLKNLREYRQVLAITTAKVPIVKFVVKKANLEADLSLYNTLALQNTKLLSTYAQIDPRVQILGYVMKYFAKLCGMGDASRGSLSSYAYTLMTLHYLQQCSPPVIPVLHKLYPNNKPPPEEKIDNWNTWFFSDIDAIPKVWSGYKKNHQNVGELWVNLLRYYTEEFNWKENVVTIRQSEPLTRLEKLWTTQCITIEDPFDLSHNLGAGLSKKMNLFIMKSFIRGREVFGAGHEAPPVGYGYTSLPSFLFDSRRLADGAPPNDRGCRYCGKIGHLVKDCPHKKQKKRPDESEAAKQRSNKEEVRPKGQGARDKVLQSVAKGIFIVDFIAEHYEVLHQFFDSELDRERLIKLGYRFYPFELFDPSQLDSEAVVLRIPCPKKENPFFGVYRSTFDENELTDYKKVLNTSVLPRLGKFLGRSIASDSPIVEVPSLPVQSKNTSSRVIGPPVPPPPAQNKLLPDHCLSSNSKDKKGRRSKKRAKRAKEQLAKS